MKCLLKLLCLCLSSLLCTTLVSCNGGDSSEWSTRPPTYTKPSVAVMGETEPSPTTPKKRVALTFDDGPHNIRTRQIVDELALYGYHATFFVVGNRVDGTAMNCAETLRYTIEKGNEIGIHGYTHSIYYNSCSEADYIRELDLTALAIQEVSPGYPISLMRPIGGSITTSRIVESSYSVIQWDVDSHDWEYKYRPGDSDEIAAQKVDSIVEHVMSNVSDGSIILMHDIYESTYDSVKIILRQLYEQGYEVVTVSDLLGADKMPGREYYCRPDGK